MRARIAAVLSLLLICFLVALPTAGASTVTLSQESETDSEEGVVTGEDETQQGEGTNEEEGEGASGADAETGAGADEQGSGSSTEEEGPPWTYQMARIGIVLMVLIGIALGALYYRMIASRQRAA